VRKRSEVFTQPRPLAALQDRLHEPARSMGIRSMTVSCGTSCDTYCGRRRPSL
jgi:hypothetical protein